MKAIRKSMAVALAGATLAGAVFPEMAWADDAAEIAALKAQVSVLMKRLDELSKKQEDEAKLQEQSRAELAQKEEKIEKTVLERIAIPQQVDSYQPGAVNMHTGESNPAVVDSQNFLHRTRDDSLSFGMPGGGGITLYGNLDVSLDDTTNGINKISNGGAAGANNGWLPALATNSTSIGLRGFQPIAGWSDPQFLWQLQTNIALTAVSGTAETNSAQSNSVSGSLTTGTSYIGFGSKQWGALKVGKTYAPYYSSTAIFNPFQGQLGSMDVVMGNTGGDNRVEFGTLQEHSIWYESPNWDGLSFAFLYSPGQNRAADSSAIPGGGSNCNGGNIPGSGGLIGGGGSNLPGAAGSPDGCNDGGFSNAVSASVVYDDKTAWYLVAAYEYHQKVNRGSDLYGAYGVSPAEANALYTLDIGNETAAKVGALYRFQSTGTWVGGIWESMRRDVPQQIEAFNERQRNGWWLMAQQKLPGANQVALGWARAGNAVGDAAGQHNFNPAVTYGNANMYTVAGWHQVDRNLSFYADYAMAANKGNDHYDLGAGGHGIKTDCHSASYGVPESGGVDSAPQCWGGTVLEGASVGMQYRF